MLVVMQLIQAVVLSCLDYCNSLLAGVLYPQHCVQNQDHISFIIGLQTVRFSCEIQSPGQVWLASARVIRETFIHC